MLRSYSGFTIAVVLMILSSSQNAASVDAPQPVLERHTSTVRVEHNKYSTAVVEHLRHKLLEQHTDQLYKDHLGRKERGAKISTDKSQDIVVRSVDMDPGFSVDRPEADRMKQSMCAAFRERDKHDASSMLELSQKYEEWAAKYVEEDEVFWKQYYETSLDTSSRMDVDKRVQELPDTIEIPDIDYVSVAIEAPDGVEAIFDSRCR